MPKARTVGPAAALALAAAASAGLSNAPSPAQAAPASAPATAGHPSPRRIWYRGAAPPQVTFPDGSRRTIRSLLDVGRAMTFGDYAWDEDGVSSGPIWVRVDIDAQLISVFRGEHEIGTAVILYGAHGKPTPVGGFRILQKAKDYVSHTYDAPMPYMLRLTNDGVAIHASAVRKGWATHGCIGVPMEFAKRLFGQARLGDAVVITGSAKS
jgi:hypothetical protein